MTLPHQCLHATPEEVERRWESVEAMPYDERWSDGLLQVCWCCCGPAKADKCSRCEGRLL